LYQGELTPRQREVAILRQAIHDQSEYELFQHDAIARGIGMTQKELDIIFGSETVTQLSDDENLICLAADEVAKLGSLTTETRNTLLNTFGRHVTTEIVLLLSVYCCVARILKSSNIPTEEVSPLEGMESPT
jgi:alkylhydroperoxidase family enzyme